MRVFDLGRKSYQETWQMQQDLLEERMRGEIDDTLLLVEHDPTISFGLNKEWNTLHVPVHSLTQQGIAFAQSSRGGGAAYLGPGQIVGYVLMDIAPYGGPLPFLRLLEEVMIRTVHAYGISVQRADAMNPTTDKLYRATWYVHEGKPSVLCTKGIGVRHRNGGQYTHHGFALHVNRVEPSYFHLIDPCGFPLEQVKPLAMSEILGRPLPLQNVKQTLISHFQTVLSEEYERRVAQR